MSIEASSMFPGFRFSPTDAELISFYLKKKMEGAEKCVEVISEVEICKYEPWDLPAKSVIQSENEWFFFSARGRKYPNGSQSRRATELGYWKATGKERNVKSGSLVIGTKRTLVFHVGRAPKGERTEWIMHEYCMDGKSQDSLVVCRLRRNVEFRPNDNSNRTSLNGRQLSVFEGGGDRVGTSEGERTAECSRKCSSSYDSHSIEQLDSASESEQKLSNEAPLAESSSQQQESKFNFHIWSRLQFQSKSLICMLLNSRILIIKMIFADILKDDIVKLDETSLSATPEFPVIARKPEAQTEAQQPGELIVSQALHLQAIPFQRNETSFSVTPEFPMITSKSEAQTEAQQPVELIASQALPLQSIPFQGTANRRIKLHRKRCGMSNAEASESNIDKYSVEETKLPSSEELPKSVLGFFSARIGNHKLISILFIILTLLVLVLSLLGGSQQVKRITYGALYRAFWE
ncbi:hypothetical protein GH714_016145 [Hevea brasiliensis]|uniref:NAC domain-containing protein n=1 Tax=Hevea brasiliensis TaxID=3981 RepID=A0A6A6MDW1_HEVBR|nr:hypothetical protein GH714_016145 [Hevea brasiliensis]